MTKSCAVIGCSPMCFPWGFDEEDEVCAALKLILINQITKLRGEGCTRFAVSMDCGVGLYAAEILQGLKESDDTLETIFFVPYEEQATKLDAGAAESVFQCPGCLYRGHKRGL